MHVSLMFFRLFFYDYFFECRGSFYLPVWSGYWILLSQQEGGVPSVLYKAIKKMLPGTPPE